MINLTDTNLISQDLPFSCFPSKQHTNREENPKKKIGVITQRIIKTI